MDRSIRRETFKFPVDVAGELDSNRIEDIYITELGFVMVCIYNPNRKVYVNYTCGKIEDILPARIKIKEEEAHRSSQQ